MEKERLEIPIIGDFGEIKLCICPSSSNAMLFEEEDAVDYGESRWQLQEGCSYEYELVLIYHNYYLPAISFPGKISLTKKNV